MGWLCPRLGAGGGGGGGQEEVIPTAAVPAVGQPAATAPCGVGAGSGWRRSMGRRAVTAAAFAVVVAAGFLAGLRLSSNPAYRGRQVRAYALGGA